MDVQSKNNHTRSFSDITVNDKIDSGKYHAKSNSASELPVRRKLSVTKSCQDLFAKRIEDDKIKSWENVLDGVIKKVTEAQSILDAEK